MNKQPDICGLIENCFEERSKKIDVIQDKKGKSKVQFRIENPNQRTYNVIPFEDCVFKDDPDGKRCDFGIKLDNKEEKKVYFIELKGSDNNEALKQISQTINRTKHCFEKFKFYARVVTSRRQPPNRLDKITERRINKLTSNNLIISQNLHIENI